MELICLQPPNPLRRNLCPLRQLIWSQPFLCPQLADSYPKTAVMLLLIAFKSRCIHLFLHGIKRPSSTERLVHA